MSMPMPGQWIVNDNHNANAMAKVKPDTQYNCNICAKAFFDKITHDAHLDSHAVCFKCTVCKELFSTENDLIWHSSKHSGIPPWKCLFCGELFSVKQSYEVHRNYCRETKENDGSSGTESGHECGEAFTDERQLVQATSTDNRVEQNHLRKDGHSNDGIVAKDDVDLPKTSQPNIPPVVKRPKMISIVIKIPTPKKLVVPPTNNVMARQISLPSETVYVPAKLVNTEDGSVGKNTPTGPKPLKLIRHKPLENLSPKPLPPLLPKPTVASPMILMKGTAEPGKKQPMFLIQRLVTQPGQPDVDGKTGKVAKQQFKCEICGRLFGTTRDYRYHNLMVHQMVKSTYKCGLCDKVLQTRDGAEGHHCGPVADRPFKCTKCHTAFTVKHRLVQHLKLAHSDERNNKCVTCGRAFKARMNLVNHCRTHTGERPFICEVCGKTFRVNHALKNHLEVHRPSGTPRAATKNKKCDACGKMYETRYQLTEHQRIHTGERPYMCEICGKSFGSRHTFASHKSSHNPIQWFKQCDLCGKTFSRKTSYRTHLLVKHSSDSEQPYMCDHCGEAFRRNADLLLHVRRQHTGERPFTCDKCGKSFMEKQRLVYHALSHDATRAHNCTICGNAYKVVQALRDHMLTHSDERPFVCTICGKTFKKKRHLKIHSGMHDEQRQLFMCDQCGESFTRSATRTRHQRDRCRAAKRVPVANTNVIENAV